ncbi:MAG TPA: hypothetical protein VN661_02220 [Candidatus Acidoferrales bacterium]|nr:hypothetical protein [Candidatus Acidoferrales bacterium]
MSETPVAVSAAHPAKMKLEPYSAEIRLSNLTLGIDNIHYDVFLSPRFAEFTRKYLLDLIRQAVNVNLLYGKEKDRKPSAPEHAAFRKLLTEVLQASLTRAKFEQAIETDVLHHLALLKHILSELGSQFSSILVECKDWIRSRGELFEHSEQAHVIRSKIAEIQAGRRNVIREAGATLYRIWCEVEDGQIARQRRALFGEAFQETYDLLRNRFLFVEGGNDDHLFLEHYVLLGNFMNDPDRFDVFDSLLRAFLGDFVLADNDADELGKARKTSERLHEQARSLRSELARIEEEEQEAAGRHGESDELFSWRFRRKPGAASGGHDSHADLRRKAALLEKNLEELGPQIEAAKQRLAFLSEEHQNRLGNYLNQPENARRIFDEHAPYPDTPPRTRSRLLQEWVHRLEERDLLFHVLAGYELRKIHSVYCPPIHLQQLKKSLVNREEAKRVEQILEQFPARKISMKKLDEASRSIRRTSEEETRVAALHFAQDLMRLRRDRRNYQQVAAWMERINLVRSEHARELSRVNKSLYEFLHPDESRPADDPVINHTVIKADVRGSTGLTKDLLNRGMNPASHFSMNLHEPVKRLLDRYGAAKVFIEGDAIILAIYETESTRATQRAVARACVLSREILAVTQAYNQRAKASGLPPLELGVGVAFQDSAPALWMDGDSRIMISRALNLSDRLSGCAKMAKRLFQGNASPFNVFLVQSLMDEAAADEGEELLVRYNMNGIEMNEEAFQKLSAEIALSPMSGNFPLPWGKERVQMHFGEVPLGESLEPIVIRKGYVRQLLPGGKIGEKAGRAFYEVCTDAKLLELARKKFAAGGSSTGAEAAVAAANENVSE